jgi:hypothetical protein
MVVVPIFWLWAYQMEVVPEALRFYWIE